MFVLEGVLILTILMSLDAVTDRGTAVDILNRLALVDWANRTYERSLDPSSIGFPIGCFAAPVCSNPARFYDCDWVGASLRAWSCACGRSSPQSDFIPSQTFETLETVYEC
jgi:hypothetical protein